VPIAVTAATEELDSALAEELFRRTRFSAAVGFVGVVIMALPHLAGPLPLQRTLGWALGLMLLLAARFLHASRTLSRLDAGETIDHAVLFEAGVCALIGLGWGISVFVFDTGQMDQAFYVRLMILAGALAFVVASTAVYLRIFLAYCLPIGVLVIVSLLVFDHVQPKSVFVVSISLYLLMLCGQALSINRGVRDTIASHQRVLQLTEDLNAVLVSERALREEIKQLSLTDELTGVMNRRGITENLELELARCRRQATPLSLLMLDIDRFKPINDTFGHAAGDEVIRLVAHALKKELRETDVIGRFGGDEFIVVLPSLGLEGALAAAHRLRQSVQFAAVDMQARGVSVTISVGVATCRQQDSMLHLMSRADGALYVAKENGRNRIEAEAQG